MAKKVIKLKITHEGWLGLCPCWFPEGCEDSPIAEPIPKFKLWFLLDLSTYIFQFINMFVKNPVFPFKIRALSKTFDLSLKINGEVE